MPPKKSPATAFDRRSVRLLAGVCFGLSVLLFLAGVVAPGQFDRAFARYSQTGLVAFTLAVFLWVLFPADFSLTKLAGADLGIKLAGPVALFVFAFWLLYAGPLRPAGDPDTRYYPVGYDHPDAAPPAAGVQFDGLTPPAQLVPVVDRQNGIYRLVGLVAVFNGGKEFTATVRHDMSGFKAQEVRFTPGLTSVPLTFQTTP